MNKMKTLTQFIKESKDGQAYTCKPQSKNELRAIIMERIKQDGLKCDLNDIDVSEITDMYYLFSNLEFNGDISKWDVSNVINMEMMFVNSPFNGDISGWDVSNVTNMKEMFYCSKFNGDISQWDVSNVTNMKEMFYCSKFNGDISQWDVSNVTNMKEMFTLSRFNGDISKWDVSRVTDNKDMFKNCSIKDEYKPKILMIEPIELDNNSISGAHLLIDSEDALEIADTPGRIETIITKLIKKLNIKDASDWTVSADDVENDMSVTVDVPDAWLTKWSDKYEKQLDKLARSLEYRLGIDYIDVDIY